MSRRPLSRLFAGAVAAVALSVPLVATPTVASAQPCDPNAGCRHGIVNKNPEWLMGWILYADKDGHGSYWVVGIYRQDGAGHCFDTKGVGVGCP